MTNKEDFYIGISLVNINIILAATVLSHSYMVYNEGTVLDQLKGIPTLKYLLILNILILVVNIVIKLKSKLNK